MDKGVKNEEGVRQAVDDESPFAKKSDTGAETAEKSSNGNLAPPPSPAY